MSEKVCRLCLVKPSVCFSLLEGNVAPMLEALTLTKVSVNDEISTIICLKCLLNLKLTYTFLQKIKKSEKKLLESAQIKQEPPALNHDDETESDLVKLCNKNCPICGVEVADGLINDHVREHFNNKQTCRTCDKSFTDFQLYKEHLLEHPAEVELKCNKCKAHFKYKSFYDLHVSTACAEKVTLDKRIAALGLRSKQAISVLTESPVKKKLLRFNNKEARERASKLGLRSSQAIKVLLGTNKEEDCVCNICFKKLTKKSFQVHSHETKTCGICRKEVPKYGYKKHLTDHDLGPQICHLCGATLQHKSGLSAHIFYIHNDLRYKCEYCGKAFQKKKGRELHVQKEHIGKPTYYCDTCGKGFFTSRLLTKHIQMKHLKMRPHMCEYCGKGFSSHYALKTHKRQHTNETPYRCEICGEGFRQNVSLRSHRKSKHDIVEETVCNCKICGKGFASSSALHSHMRLH